MPTTPPVGCPAAPDPGAITYYACDCGADADANCVPGNDSNAGTSPATAWRSFEKARAQFGSLRAGDRIGFCRGGGFAIGASRKWVNSACRADKRCVVAGYDPPWASGDEGRPVIHAVAGQNGIELDDAANADHEEGYVFAGLELKGAVGGWGIFVYNDIDDVLICDAFIHNFDIGVHLEGGNPPNPGADTHNDRIVMRDSIVNDNPGQGWLGADNGTSIETSHFENNGAGRAVFNHNIYLSSAAASSNVRVIGNNLYRSAFIAGRCQGVSLVGHGIIDGLVIEGNVVREDMGAADPGCWGIAINAAYATAESFKNVVIRGNTVVNVGNLSIGVNACQDCVIENNVVINQQNLNSQAIQAPATTGEAGDATDNRITIRNNSIDIDVGGAISLGTEGTGHVVVSNAIYSGGGGTASCFGMGLPPTAYAAVDYNVCFLNGRGEWARGQGTLATWSQVTGFDQHSKLVNPGFKTITAPYDLSPAATSPLVNMGHPQNSSATDLTGKTRDGQPDVGAYEQ